jgi:hypothetical protein
MSAVVATPARPATRRQVLGVRPALLATIVGLALAGGVASAFANGYQQYVIAMVAITAIVGVGLNVLLGLAGQLSLGHVGFYALGAYTCAILTTQFEWSFWLVLPLGGVVAALAGAVLAVPALRVRGPYLAMVTIAFGFVIEQSAAEMKGLTGGWNGIMNIPRPEFSGLPMNELGIGVFSLALLAVLLLRGPQTAAEQRSRSERLHTFASNEDVDATLRELAERELAVEGARHRWQQLLGDADDAPPAAPPSDLEARVAELERIVAELQSRLD